MRKLLAGVAVLTSFGFTHAMAAAPACDHDRTCLSSVMDAYLQAVLKHNPAALPTTRNIKYTENGVRLALGDGLWQTAAAMPTYRLDVIDEEAGAVGMLGRISENGNINWYGVRLKVEPDGKVSQIETLVNRSAGGGGGPPSGSKQNTEPHPLMAQVLPENKRLSRAELARISNTYFTGLDT